MADYQVLTDDDKAEIVAEVQAAAAKRDDVFRAAEAAHYRAALEVKAGLRGADSGPGEYVAPTEEAD